MFSRSLLCAGILLTSHGAHATDHASMKASPSSTTAFRLLAEDDRLFRQQLDLTMVFKRHCNSCKGPMPEGIRGTYDACQCGKTDWVPKNAPFNCDLTQLPGQWWCDLEMPNNDPEEQKVDFAPELRAVNRIKAVTLRRMRDLPRHVEALVHGDTRWVLELVYEDEHVDVLAYCAPIPQCPECLEDNNSSKCGTCYGLRYFDELPGSNSNQWYKLSSDRPCACGKYDLAQRRDQGDSAAADELDNLLGLEKAREGFGDLEACCNDNGIAQVHLTVKDYYGYCRNNKHTHEHTCTTYGDGCWLAPDLTAIPRVWVQTDFEEIRTTITD